MTLDEATAALSANPAALYLAGRDCDDIIAAVLRGFDPATEANVKAFRASLIGQDAPTRLMLTNEAIKTFGTVAAQREQEAIDAKALIAQREADSRRADFQRQKETERRDRVSRLFHPILSTLRTRIDAFESQVVLAKTAADFGTLENDLTDAFSAATTSVAVGASTLIGA